MLSTVDNPYNPYSNWKEWYAYDTEHGYFCCSYLARVFESLNLSYLNDEQKAKAIQKAIHFLVSQDKTGLYCKVYKDEDVKPIDISE